MSDSDEELIHVLHMLEWRDWELTAEERAALVELAELREAPLFLKMEAFVEAVHSLREAIINALVEGFSLLRGRRR